MICCLVFNIGIGCLELRYADDSRISNEYSNVETKWRTISISDLNWIS